MSYQTDLVIETITVVNDEPVKNCFPSWSDSRLLTFMMGMNLPKMIQLTLELSSFLAHARVSDFLYRGRQ
jgi:hypothetical protein